MTGAAGEAGVAPGWIDADWDVRGWSCWVGSDDAEPALSLADAGLGPASGPGRPCSPTVSRDPGIYGLSRPACCDLSKAPGNYTTGEGKPASGWVVAGLAWVVGWQRDRSFGEEAAGCC